MTRLVYCCLFLAFILPATTNACGYYLFGEDYRIALLNPYVIGEDYSAFFYSSDILNHTQNAQVGHDRRRNSELWAEELGPGVTWEDVMMLLYGVNLPSRQLAIALSNQDPNHNPAQAAIKRRPDLQEYFNLIKAYETTEVLDWWDESEPAAPDAPDYQRLAQRGYDKAAPGSFLKERYAYQLLLLAYYADDDAAMATYFNRHFKGKTGPLADWARFHFAGQWNEEGRYVVEMANAFRYAPEKNLAAYRRTKGMGAPEQYLPVTKSDTERANLYALAALHRPGKALEMIRRAYTFDPGSPLIELLLVREFNKVEDWLMSHRLTNVGPAVASFQSPRWDENYWKNLDRIRRESFKTDRAYLKELRTFIDGYRSGRPDFAQILRAQAALLDEDYLTALNYARLLEQQPGTIGNQARIVSYLATLQNKQTNKGELDNFVAQNLPRLEALFTEDDNLKPALSRITAQVYAERGDTVSAYLLHNRSLALPSGYEWATEYYSQIDFLDRKISDGMMRRVIALLAGQPLKTPLNALLLASDQPHINAVRDLAGTLALRRNDLALALRYFEQIPNEWYKNNYYFSDYLRESPLSDIVGNPISFTSKTDLMRQMLVLEEMSDKGGDAGAAACLALGKAWYNMGGFGGGWMMLRYGDSNSYSRPSPQPWPASEGHSAVPHNADDFALAYQASRADEYLDCAEASTSDKELMAAIAFHRNALAYRRWLVENERPWYVEPKLGEETSEDVHRKLFYPYVALYQSTDFYRVTAQQCSSLGLY